MEQKKAPFPFTQANGNKFLLQPVDKNSLNTGKVIYSFTSIFSYLIHKALNISSSYK